MKRETIAIHGGFAGDPETHAVAVPVYQTTSYYFDNTQHGADLFDLKVPGNIYSRIMNPTNAVLEQRVAELEGGIGALAMASGMAAITAAIQTLARVGDNVVSVSQLYGGTYNLFAHTLPTLGIEVRFADGNDPAAIGALIDDRTKAVFCESIGNPAGNIVDIRGAESVSLRSVAFDAGRALQVSKPLLELEYAQAPFSLERAARFAGQELSKFRLQFTYIPIGLAAFGAFLLTVGFLALPKS